MAGEIALLRFKAVMLSLAFQYVQGDFQTSINALRVYLQWAVRDNKRHSREGFHTAETDMIASAEVTKPLFMLHRQMVSVGGVCKQGL